MSAPTPLRQDFDASQLRGLARKTKDGPRARRLLALAAIYDGATRTEAAKIGGGRRAAVAGTARYRLLLIFRLDVLKLPTAFCFSFHLNNHWTVHHRTDYVVDGFV
jgi:hypothetical protein